MPPLSGCFYRREGACDFGRKPSSALGTARAGPRSLGLCLPSVAMLGLRTGDWGLSDFSPSSATVSSLTLLVGQAPGTCGFPLTHSRFQVLESTSLGWSRSRHRGVLRASPLLQLPPIVPGGALCPGCIPAQRSGFEFRSGCFRSGRHIRAPTLWDPLRGNDTEKVLLCGRVKLLKPFNFASCRSSKDLCQPLTNPLGQKLHTRNYRPVPCDECNFKS